MPSSLRILHIMWSAEMGGISKVVLHLCEEQIKDSDLEIEVFCAKGKSSLFSEFEKKGIRITAGKFSGGYHLPFSAIKTYEKWMATFDILHFHSYNPILGYAAHKSGKKIIYTEHGNFGIGRKKKINDLVVSWMQKHFLNNRVDAITFNSEFTKSMAVQRYGLSKTKNEIVYNGVPHPSNHEIAQPLFRKNSNEFIIAAIGRLALVKRFDRLIHAFSKTNSSFSRLIIMGSGPEEVSLKEISKLTGRENKILFSGQGNSSQLLQESDVCVVSSEGEAFGLVAIEAYQLGKRVIVYKDGGGVTELVKQLEPDSVVADDDDMARLLTAIMEQPIEAPSNIENRKKYASRFSMKNMSTKFKNIYQSL